MIFRALVRVGSLRDTRSDLERLDRMPLVIFTTAFDQYAIRAFEVNALDYLMKPVAPERLAAALDRVRQRAGGASRGPLERVFVREGERCWIVNVADIRLLESEGNYTRLYFGVHRPLILRSLQALEARLDSAVFFRASRSRIMNLRWVAGVDTDVDGGLIVTLRDGQLSFSPFRPSAKSQMPFTIIQSVPSRAAAE